MKYLNFDSKLFERAQFFIIAVYLLSLAYSEALKNISLSCMVVFFVLQLLSKRINISRDFINITAFFSCRKILPTSSHFD